jgi:hypothetical protein
MSDENNIHTNLEEHKDTPLEARPEEPQQMAESESSETEAQRQEDAKKPSSNPKAIRLATISKLHTRAKIIRFTRFERFLAMSSSDQQTYNFARCHNKYTT